MKDKPKQPASPPEVEAAGPSAIRRNLAIMAAGTNAPPPGDGREFPPVCVRQPLSVIARSCGMVMHGAPLFRFAGGLVTVMESGEMEVMSPERFCSWAEEHLCFTTPTKDGPEVRSIGRDLAGKIMAADQFRCHLRELKAVHQVRLPVWRGEGKDRTIELSPEGFDPSTGILTVDALPYNHELPAVDGAAFLIEMLREFPWETDGEANFARRRSFSAMVAAMVGAYCFGLFPEGTARPLVIFNANQPGSGKTLLARMVICPAHGMPGETTIPKDENEFRKILTSAAYGREPFLLLDDVESLRSHALNSFITSTVHKDRVMNSQTTRSISKVTQCLATGNGLRITEDLERRALIVDLFEAREASARTFHHEITSEWLATTETRAKFLAALWAIVRHWRNDGMPNNPQCHRGSFEHWSRIVGSIVTTVLFSNPFADRQSEMGGDEAGRATVRVLAILAGEGETDHPPEPTPQEVIDVAEREGLLEVIAPDAKEPKKALGHRLRKLRGRQFTDTQGRLFEFGRRDKAAGAVYPIRYLPLPKR